MKVSIRALFGNVVQQIKGDLLTRALSFVDYFHHEIHGGRAYSITGRVTLPVGGIYEFLFITPDTTRWLHFEDVEAHSDGALTVTAFHSSSKTDASGNRITPSNRNLNSSNVTVATICHTPGGSGDGTQFWTRSAGADHPLSEGASISAGRREWIFKQNSSHLVRFTGAQGDIVDYGFEWYEHQP